MSSGGPQGDGTYDQDWLIGALTRLQARYPAFIRRLTRSELTIDVGFYVEDLAIECAQNLLDAGITAVHRLDNPRTISLQIPSLLAQSQIQQVPMLLERFFYQRASQGPARRRQP